MRHPSFRQCIFGIAIAAAMVAPVPAAAQYVAPVLMVIANQDYGHEEYAGMRAALEGRGLQVVVAAGALTEAVPQGGKRLKRPVRPDVRLTDADAADYSAIVFVGGWGASSYQYAFEGTYANAIYRPGGAVAAAANRLINDFVMQDKPVAGICHGTTVLAWARVDGVSPLKGRTITAWAGGGPGFERDETVYPDSSVPLRTQFEENGAAVILSATIGDPLSSHDDVWVDGRIITGENPASAPATGKTLAAVLLGK